jgi:hypothetical protein
MTNGTRTPTTRRRRGNATVESTWKQMSLRVAPEVKARITRQAERLDLPDIDYVRQAVMAQLEKDEAAEGGQ